MGGHHSSDEERRRRKKKQRRSRSRSSASSEASSRSNASKKAKLKKRRSRSRSRSRRDGASRSAKPSSVRSRSGSRERRRRRSTSRDRRRSTSRDRKKTPRHYRSSRSKSPARRSKHSSRRTTRSRSKERKRRSSSSRSPSPVKERVEAFGKPLPPKPRVESSDDEETKLAKEKAKKKTPYAVFDLRRDDEEEARAKRLADIEEDGFQQSTFKSSRGDKNADAAADKTPAVASCHDDAIFGGGSSSSSGKNDKVKNEFKSEDVSPSVAVIKKEETRPSSLLERVFEVRLPDNMADVDLKGLLAHPSLYEDPKIRDARWKRKWLTMRRKKMEEMRSAGPNAITTGISIF